MPEEAFIVSYQSNITGKIVSLQQDGGALFGIGDKFSPDMRTGASNSNVPITALNSRDAFQSDFNLVYITSTGNDPFGLGWSLSNIGVSRKTSDSVSLYHEVATHLKPGERRDVFILPMVENLVPVSGSYPGEIIYQPETEGLFTRITHHQTPDPGSNNYC